VVTRRDNHLAALLLAVAVAAAPIRAQAQIAAPKLVDDAEETSDEPAPRPALPQTPTVRPGARAERVLEPAAGASTAPAPTASTPAAAPGAAPSPAGSAALPPPLPSPTPASDLARRIVPVSVTWETLLGHWTERRTALHEADPARAEAAQKALLAAQRELGIENLVPFAAVEVRESGRALAANLGAEAVARADLAVALAPDFPDAHLARARALFATAPTEPGRVLSALGDAFAAAAREPHAIRAFYGDLLSAAFAALFTAAAATILLLLVRRLRLFLHDFHHLPLLRGTASIQTGFLALVLLGIPLAFGLGAFAILGVATLAAWLYLSLSDRIVATVALGAILAMPWAAGEAARFTAWTGSEAERIHAIEHGAITDEEAAELGASGATTQPSAPLLAALGRHAKRRGDLDRALRLYHEAAAADPRAPELEVNVANVLFMKGDLEGAKAGYLAAQDHAGGDLIVLGAAHYGLSKLYLRTSEMDKSAAAREKADREAGDFLHAHGSDEDFSANRYLVDVPVSDRKLAALAASDGSPEAVGTWVRARVMGALPRKLWPWGGVAFLAVLWLLALAAPYIASSRPCTTCGRPACKRCDGAVGPACGQCVNVYQKKGVVDARDRLRKEAQVRRHEQFTRTATRVLAVVGGGAGHVFNGAAAAGALFLFAILFSVFVIWFWRGIMPPPQPSQYVLACKVVTAFPVGVAVWVLAVRDAFRRTRGS
jgi:hypothetical protein